MRLVAPLSIVLLGAVLALAIVIYPDFASAQILKGGIVPCDGKDCGTCHIFQLADNVLQFTVGLAIIVSALMFAIAGIILMANAGNESRITFAKGMFAKVFIGLIVVFAAWLLVDTIIKVLTNNTRGLGQPWVSINCSFEDLINQEDSNSKTPSSSSGVSARSPAPKPKFCEQCDNVLNTRLETLNTTFPSGSNGWSVSEVPLQTGQLNSCFESGTCTHIELSEKTGNNINDFAANARVNDLRITYVVPTDDRRAELKFDQRLQPNINVLVVPSVEKEHFQVFRN